MLPIFSDVKTIDGELNVQTAELTVAPFIVTVQLETDERVNAAGKLSTRSKSVENELVGLSCI